MGFEVSTLDWEASAPHLKTGLKVEGLRPGAWSYGVFRVQGRVSGFREGPGVDEVEHKDAIRR